MAASGERIAFDLRAGELGETDLSVFRVDGQEGLSDPYAFDVSFVPASGEPIDLDALVGSEAVLTLRRPTGEERFVHGECVRVELLEVAAGVPRYRARIGPRLLRLRHVSRSRIFQGKNVPGVVQQVLAEHGIAHRSALSGSYPAREYVTQFREDDLGFVSRLLESAGIWYRFEHGEGGHTLVLGDGTGALAPADDGVPVREPGQGEGIEHVFRLERDRRVVPEASTRRDYDFERPALDLTAGAGKGELEVYEYPGGHQEPGDGRKQAQARLEELGYGAEEVHGEGTSLAFVPGAKVAIEEEGTFAIVRVRHRGEQERAAGASGEVGTRYENAFEAIDAARPYRPRRRTPVPRLVGIQTATVVGPDSEEVHVDQHGRVKLLFHWDREGRRGDQSSCWVRVAQAWAGAGMGASFVPRVGQEVVVRFLDGSPDRPLVTGSVFNGANTLPLALPQDKTRSTLRTDTSPGSGGYNELRFEDAAGAEEVHLHAQRDLNSVVENDSATEVRVNAALEVGKDRSQMILGRQELRVALDDSSDVGGNAAVTVTGERLTAVALDHHEEIAGAQEVSVGGNRHVSVSAASADFVGAGAALNIGGGYAVTVGGAVNHAVGGAKGVEVGGQAIEVVGAHREERVVGDRTAKTGGSSDVEIDGQAASSTGADEATKVDGGEQWKVDGAVAEVAQAITLKADRFTLMVGGKRILSLDRSGALTLSGTTVSLDATVAAKGAKVSLVSPAPPAAGTAQAQVLQATDPQMAVARFTLVDRDGRPVANQRFRVEFPDGTVRRGATDQSGRGRVPAPKRGKFKLVLIGVDPKDVKTR